MIARRTPRLAAALLALPLLLTACAGESAEVSSPAPEATTPAAAAPATSAAVPTVGPTEGQAVDEEDTTQIAVTVAGGKATGDTGRVPVALGSRVRLTVTADVTDEIHVHGYDLHEDTATGTPATLEFVADQPGVFEVELEESRVLLTRLQVQ